MTEKMKNILIGLFVASAVTIMIAMILFLEPQIGDGKKTLHVRFANIAGIAVGTRVTFAGKPIGEVFSIREILSAREESLQGHDRIYPYELTLKIDSKTLVYPSDEIAIRSTGLMGERSVSILPKKDPSHPRPVENEILYALSVDPLESTFSHIAKVSTRMESTLEHLDTWFEGNKVTLASAIQNLDKVLHQGNTFVQSMNDHALPQELTQTCTLLQDNLSHIHTALTEGNLLHNISSLTQNWNTSFQKDGALALQYLHECTRDIAQGKGTLGRFIQSDDFYLRLSSLLGKGETLMHDINHYGLLFQYDKGWQKNRTRKANLAQSLRSPKEFQQYFENEVSSISTSLGRLTELLQTARQEKGELTEREDFKTQLQDLLRNVQSLSDSIRLYHQDLFAPASDKERTK